MYWLRVTRYWLHGSLYILLWVWASPGILCVSFKGLNQPFFSYRYMPTTNSPVDTNNPIVQQHIINLLNLDYLPDTQKAVLLDKMVEVVNQRALLRILEGLDKEKKDEFGKLLDSGTDEALQEFIQVNVPDFVTMLTEETIKLKKEVVEKVEQNNQDTSNKLQTNSNI